jgi:hypothetical protein
MRTTTSRHVSCLCASSLIVNKHLSHILGIECLLLPLLLHRSTMFHFHHKSSSSSSINIRSLHHLLSTSRHLLKDLAHLIKVCLSPIFIKSLLHLTSCADFSQRSIGFDSLNFTARLFLHATHQDALSLRIFCQKQNSELFSLFLTLLLIGNSNSHLHSTFFHFKLHIRTFSSFLLLLHFTSSHMLHTTIFHLFDIKSISNRFFRQKHHQTSSLSQHQIHQKRHLNFRNNFSSSKSSQPSTTLLFSFFFSHQVHFFDKT